MEKTKWKEIQIGRCNHSQVRKAEAEAQAKKIMLLTA